jgi:biotin carboxyl carrier protein
VNGYSIAVGCRFLPGLRRCSFVTVGQVLCVIDVAGQLNEIEAEVAGEVVAIHGKNGEPVKAGEALFEIEAAA